MGKVKPDKKVYEIDFWKAKGVYALFDNFRCIYVGKALNTDLGNRLKAHTMDKLRHRWDMFSFYTLSTINIGSKMTRDPGKRYLDSSMIIDSFEALAILIADPALNRRRERFKDAHEVIQITNTEEYYDPIEDKINDLMTIVTRLESKIK